MLRLAFDFIITWRETRTRPNAYDYPTPTRMAQDKNLPVESKIFNHGGRHHKK